MSPNAVLVMAGLSQPPDDGRRKERPGQCVSVREHLLKDELPDQAQPFPAACRGGISRRLILSGT